MIVPRYYEDLSVLHDNTMPARAYRAQRAVRQNAAIEWYMEVSVF